MSPVCDDFSREDESWYFVSNYCDQPLNEEQEQSWLDAITHAAISCLRPVTMAAITTIMGMLPLLGDVFFQPMAVTIMFAQGLATLLTLIVVPVLFALFYKVRLLPERQAQRLETCLVSVSGETAA